MKKNNGWIILAVAIVIALLLVAYFVGQKNQEPVLLPDDQVEITPPIKVANPCEDILLLKQDLLFAEADLLKAQEKVNMTKIDLQAAQEKCSELTKIDKKSSVKKRTVKKTSSPSSSSYVEKKSPPSSTSYYEEPAQPSVSTGVRTGSSSKTLICFNLRDMDNSSYWPALTIEAGGSVEGQTKNIDGSGWNIETYPVPEPEGLYGACTDGRIFIRADMVDGLGPTVIRAGGGTKGTWNNWLTLSLQGDYYVSQRP